MSKFLEDWFSPHWQFILSGLLYFTGKDLLHSADGNYWVVQSGQWCMDVAIYVMGFKAVSETAKNIEIKP